MAWIYFLFFIWTLIYQFCYSWLIRLSLANIDNFTWFSSLWLSFVYLACFVSNLLNWAPFCPQFCFKYHVVLSLWAKTLFYFSCYLSLSFFVYRGVWFYWVPNMTSYLKPESALKKAEGGFKRFFFWPNQEIIYSLWFMIFFLAFCFNKTLNAID